MNSSGFDFGLPSYAVLLLGPFLFVMFVTALSITGFAAFEFLPSLVAWLANPLLIFLWIRFGVGSPLGTKAAKAAALYPAVALAAVWIQFALSQGPKTFFGVGAPLWAVSIAAAAYGVSRPLPRIES